MRARRGQLAGWLAGWVAGVVAAWLLNADDAAREGGEPSAACGAMDAADDDEGILSDDAFGSEDEQKWQDVWRSRHGRRCTSG